MQILRPKSGLCRNSTRNSFGINTHFPSARVEFLLPMSPRNPHDFSHGFLRTSAMVQNGVRKNNFITIVRKRYFFCVQNHFRTIKVGDNYSLESAA